MYYGQLFSEEGFPFTGQKLNKLKAFLAKEGLSYDDSCEYSVLLEDENGSIAATGSLNGNVLKCIAVDDACQGEGLSAVVVTSLVNQAVKQGRTHLFLFTKPGNQRMFTDLGFEPILSTGDILFMENEKGGLASFVRTLSDSCSEKIRVFEKENQRSAVQGAIVANCNPFTKGHRYLIEEALKQCDFLHLFILSEDKSAFSAADRYEMVRLGVLDMNPSLKERIFLHPTSDYMISAATFPTYFIKDQVRAAKANCELDVRIFAKCIAGPLGITKRFVGTEPDDEVTNAYNETMKRILPEYGIELIEIERLTDSGKPISAKRARQLIKENRSDELSDLLPETTIQYLI